MTKLKINLKEIISITNPSKIDINDKHPQYFLGFSSISSSKEGYVTFCSSKNSNGKKLIELSKASLIICPSEFSNFSFSTNASLLFVKNPRYAFIQCLNKFLISKRKTGIHPTAIVETKKIGKNCYIGPFTYVDENVSIGDNTIIYGNVYIYDNVKIGNNVIIHVASVIGSDGFGFEVNLENKLERFPHIGGVEIHDDVEIGANNCIDRGTLDNTIVGQGTKTDNNVHIAHNVKIGKNCAFAAGVTLSGSCIVEDNVFFGTSAVVRDWIKIGKKAFIGIGSVVVKDVPSNTTVMGVPAKSINKIFKSWTDKEN